MVSRLQTENQRLSQETKGKSSSTEALNFDSGLIQKLEEQVSKQRNEIKHKNCEIQEKLEHIEQNLVEIDQQKHQNTEIKKRSKLLQNQVKSLCEERADFLAKIQDQHREMVTLKKKLGIAEKENEDLEKDESTTPRFTIAELKEVLAERNELKNRVNDLEEELMAFKPLSSNPHDEKLTPEIEEDAPVQGKIIHLFCCYL
jgi:RILP-like protein 1